MSNRNNKLHSLFTVVKRPLLVLLAAIAPVMTQYAQAGTLGGSTSFSGAWGWTFSYEIMQFTRANTTFEVTHEDGTIETIIIAAPTFDITENPDSFTPPDVDGTSTGTGSALFKGILKVTHGPDVGEAWAEVQMKWPEVDITIETEAVDVIDPNNNGDPEDNYTFLKESRFYKVVLDNGINTDKLTDGFKRVVPGLPHTDVYDICDGTNTSHLCYQDIGYGTVAFDPSDIFKSILTASGKEIGPETGFYWDEVCLAFHPEDLDVQFGVDGQDFNLKEDDDGYFRACEGRSVAFNVCTNPGNDPFSCKDTNDGVPFTLTLADAAAGDRLEPAPTSVCIGTNVEDWLGLIAYVGEDVVITPCDPSQGYILFPYVFSDSEIKFTSSEGDNAVIDGLQIISIGTRSELETAVFLEESADKTNSIYDFSNILLNNVSYISSVELDDTITGSAGTDVILGGNGEDRLFGFSGDDCLDGGQNNDELWGDGHAVEANDQGSRGADVFVLTSKLGKDAIRDFDSSEGDVIVNVSGSPSSVTPNGEGTCTVALKGQNFVTVNLGSFDCSDDSSDVVDADDLTQYPQCSGYPAN
jgi:hypothetical protein